METPRRRFLLGRLLFGLVAAGALTAARADAQCSGATHVAWPSASPVWDFCYKRPSQTVSEGNGSGIELTNVRYKGVLILRTAHIPILNVKYEPGGCGGSNLCYRDWLYEESSFDCAPSRSGRCSGATVPASTVCDHPGSDAGSFRGVALEDLGDRLRLTSQCGAGWYRYIPVWEFAADGTLRAAFEVTAVDNGCVAYMHHHHAYFRLDFDVAGAGGDFVDYVLPDDSTRRIRRERSFTDTSPLRSHWRIGSMGSNAVVDVVRNTGDEAAGDPSPVANDFPMGDGWVVAYKPGEISDGSFGCAAELDSFVDGQSVNNANVVLWVHASTLHAGEPGGLATDCGVIGPTIKVTLR
jgi:hypothetical protein